MMMIVSIMISVDVCSVIHCRLLVMSRFERTFLLLLLLCLLSIDQICSQFEWISYDKIDEIMERINSVNSINCFEKQPSELVLPDEAVYQKPSIDMLRKDLIMRNRTQLLHVRNIAHRNALLYSYLFQRLFDSEEPGLTYILLHNAGKMSKEIVEFEMHVFILQRMSLLVVGCSTVQESISIKIHIIHIGIRTFSIRLFHYLARTRGEPMISMVNLSLICLV